MEASKVAKTSNTMLRLAASMVLIVCGTLLFTALPAHAWWNKDWQLRRQIDLNTTPQGADVKEAVTNVPVLVRLHSGNFDFKKPKPDGSDLRFVGGDDQTQLKYAIDTFDVINEIALVWVNVPELKANSADNRLFVYYGNEKAADSQDKAAVFGFGQALVFHFGETQGPPQDATSNKNNAARFSGGQALPSVAGTGIAFYGGRDTLNVAASPTLKLAEGFTLTAWVKISQPSSDGYLFSQTEQDSDIVVGINGDKPYFRITGNGTVTQAESATALTMGNWHHLALAAKPAGKVSLFVDGQEVAAANMSMPIPAMKTDVFFGSLLGESHPLIAEVDEIALSTAPRSPGYIAALFASQGIQSKLLTYGPETANSSSSVLPTYYLKTITKNITFDGWLIIGMLIIMGIAAMWVFIAKTFSFYQNQKYNDNFKESFARMETILNPGKDMEEHESSPLFRIYNAGFLAFKRIHRDKGENDPSELDKQDLDYFKTTLEKGFIEETKGLGNRILILTLAISGGPFLGLLGTVWGVMNTFAAMAEAGEANIMAIAPGIASALATTVFGLVVAIPALFGYNYLAGRIKNQTAELGIFIDEFILLVEREHGTRR